MLAVASEAASANFEKSEADINPALAELARFGVIEITPFASLIVSAEDWSPAAETPVIIFRQAEAVTSYTFIVPSVLLKMRRPSNRFVFGSLASTSKLPLIS